MSDSDNSRRVTVRDIAKELGVSHVTVSLALRGRGRISEALRERIREVAERMGYKPDPMLAALASYSRRGNGPKPISSVIAWLNGWRDPAELRTFKEFDLYWKGAFAAAEKFGFRLEEFQFGGGLSAMRLHQILSTRGIKGIVLPPHRTHPDWKDFPWSEYSVIRFGRSLVSPRTHLVTADQVANTMLAFEKMRERGYKRIGFVTDESNFKLRGHLFEGGYLTAQRFVEAKDRLPVFVLNDHAEAHRGEALRAWFDKRKPDAIITNMPEVPALLGSIGLKIPDDVALAGTTQIDIPIGAGIDQHPEEIGRVGILTLISLINDGARGIPRIFRQNLVEGSWVDGDSLPDLHAR
ncbi:LacI family DNA-binding transcriptional regulator [Luteolibacter sp. LG18]|uniref:LacI family DNA-binding transcriptional regulator n=1 Tax=Luteolibacter sp. LG18 TaxID=2819286 RepID=UPI002B2C6530|nr:LacI family transcriptional regulator [Luteolibacter sp. LG18]